ncbi:MAG: 16S rRNA (guanine(966)-N(2))-methyltransferase RsmD [Solirubrobacterales bacterium]|nr:16S rRNA (guanine(966)-N(2))-methyltransferase RsmD [Solirubrobacterales bacterium]
MRIVAGIHGGRRIAGPKGETTRPTSDRVREALFSTLGPLEDVVVLDLFAGSGALGLEALSRGAARAVFVERDRWALTVLASNIAALGEPPERAEVRTGDARHIAEAAAKAGEAYDLVFLDPPYRDASRLGGDLGPVLARLLKPGARVATESDRRHPLELTDLPRTHERRYGDTLIRIHTT